MKEKIYKLFLILMVSLSLGSGSLAQNEIRKLLEALSGTGDIQVVQELDEEAEYEYFRQAKAEVETTMIGEGLFSRYSMIDIV